MNNTYLWHKEIWFSVQSPLDHSHNWLIRKNKRKSLLILIADVSVSCNMIDNGLPEQFGVVVMLWNFILELSVSNLKSRTENINSHVCCFIPRCHVNCMIVHRPQMSYNCLLPSLCLFDFHQDIRILMNEAASAWENSRWFGPPDGAVSPSTVSPWRLEHKFWSLPEKDKITQHRSLPTRLTVR